jgi:extracellular factor (EF) 3-hydroxypalmitic acid methyl ester biosynthesis protein
MQNYEQLSGAEGRRIFYRSKRFSAKSLFNGLLPITEIGNVPHRLTDLSISGLAAINRSEKAELTVGEEVPVDLRINNLSLHHGTGKIVRAEPTFAGTKIALNFVDGYLDIPALLAKHREQSLRQQLNEEFEISNETLDPAYRLLCMDFLHTQRQYKAMLQSWIENNPNAQNDEALVDEMVALCEEHFKEKWRGFQREANRLMEKASSNPGALETMKRFTESVVTPDLMDGPIWRRSYEKPLGYPGDHVVMNYVYSWKDEGETIAGKFAHRLGLDALECVATRMTMMQNIMAREINAKKSDEEVRIANLACGTAQEIVNILKQPSLDKRVTFSLVDQDEKALAHAYEHAYPFSVRHGGKTSIQCFHSSFTELMKGGALTNHLPQQDVIYSVGLFDYLRAKRASSLVRSLYQYVRPGGLLVIGNLKRSIDSGVWAGEMICDWTMFYRTEQEMRDMAEGIQYETLEVLTDKTNRVYMLCIRKPEDNDMTSL